MEIWDCIKAEGTLEAKLLVPIGAIREPRQTKWKKEKSDQVIPHKWLVKYVEAQGRIHRCLVDTKLRGWERCCVHG
jgi:hypothetical protein